MNQQLSAQLSAQIHLLDHSSDPVHLLRAAVKISKLAVLLEIQQLHLARAASVSWGQIGMLYGTSKQAAQARYDRMLRREPG